MDLNQAVIARRLASAAEAFFGYMLRGSAQRGAPFEAAT
jgi:hypothetical protein